MIDTSVILGRLTACQDPITDEILKEVVHNVVADFFSTQQAHQLLAKALDTNKPFPSEEFFEIIDTIIKATIPVMLFDPLVERERPLLYALAMRILKNHHEAEDVVQESLIKAYISMKNFSLKQLETLRIRPWLCTIVRNTAINYRVRESRVVHLDLSEGSEFLEMEGNRFEQPEVALLVDEGAEEFRELIRRLPQQTRALILLHYQENYDYKQVAEFMNISSLGTLKSYMHRSIRLLRKIAESRGIGKKDLEIWAQEAYHDF